MPEGAESRRGVRGQAVASLFGETHARAAVAACQFLALVWVEVLGHRTSTLARTFSQIRGYVSRVSQRGAAHAFHRQAAIPTRCWLIR